MLKQLTRPFGLYGSNQFVDTLFVINVEDGQRDLSAKYHSWAIRKFPSKILF